MFAIDETTVLMISQDCVVQKISLEWDKPGMMLLKLNKNCLDEMFTLPM